MRPAAISTSSVLTHPARCGVRVQSYPLKGFSQQCNQPYCSWKGAKRNTFQMVLVRRCRDAHPPVCRTDMSSLCCQAQRNMVLVRLSPLSPRWCTRVSLLSPLSSPPSSPLLLFSSLPPSLLALFGRSTPATQPTSSRPRGRPSRSSTAASSAGTSCTSRTCATGPGPWLFARATEETPSTLSYLPACRLFGCVGPSSWLFGGGNTNAALERRPPPVCCTCMSSLWCDQVRGRWRREHHRRPIPSGGETPPLPCAPPRPVRRASLEPVPMAITGALPSSLPLRPPHPPPTTRGWAEWPARTTFTASCSGRTRPTRPSAGATSRTTRRCALFSLKHNPG